MKLVWNSEANVETVTVGIISINSIILPHVLTKHYARNVSVTLMAK